jgi:hypothetical protein
VKAKPLHKTRGCNPKPRPSVAARSGSLRPVTDVVLWVSTVSAVSTVVKYVPPCPTTFSNLDKFLQNGQHGDWPWSNNCMEKHEENPSSFA